MLIVLSVMALAVGMAAGVIVWIVRSELEIQTLKEKRKPKRKRDEDWSDMVEEPRQLEDLVPTPKPFVYPAADNPWQPKSISGQFVVPPSAPTVGTYGDWLDGVRVNSAYPTGMFVATSAHVLWPKTDLEIMFEHGVHEGARRNFMARHPELETGYKPPRAESGEND